MTTNVVALPICSPTQGPPCQIVVIDGCPAFLPCPPQPVPITSAWLIVGLTLAIIFTVLFVKELRK
jgi:hypothetical protein